MSDLQSESVHAEASENVEQGQKVKVFQFENGRIHYINVQQTLVAEKSDRDSALLVHNYLCYQEEDRLIKITQILLEDKVLRIKDELKIISEVDQEEKQEKRRQGVFGRRNNYSDPDKEQKSDTKNLIKNIINLFSNWLRIKNTEQSEQASRKLKKIIKKMKYFNKLLIQQLCKDRQICNCFIEFSETDSETAIENSRIKDKQCHSKAIKNYTKLFSQSRVKLDKESTKSSQSNMEN